MAIANPALPNPLREKLQLRLKEIIRERAGGSEGRWRNRLPDERSHLREIFVGADPQPLRPAPFLDLRGGSFGIVEPAQTRDHASDLSLSDGAFDEQFIQEKVGRQLPHFYGVLND